MNSNEQIHTTIVIAPDTGKIWWKKSAVETQSLADTFCLHGAVTWNLKAPAIHIFAGVESVYRCQSYNRTMVCPFGCRCRP